MGTSPVAVLIIVIASLAFEGMLYGGEIAERSFPTLEEPNEGDCSGLLDGFVCGVQYVINFFKVIFGVIVFVFNVVTFNVPGAPWFVRAVVGTAIGASILWSVVTLFRGN